MISLSQISVNFSMRLVTVCKRREQIARLFVKSSFTKRASVLGGRLMG